jgi:hypothetical protein
VKSPWSYKKWSSDTYVAFHALRTYATILCLKQKEETVVSLRVIRSRTKTVVRSNALKGAFREFVRRYAEAIIEKRKHYIIIDCKKYFALEARVLTHLMKHSEVKYLDKIDMGLKKIFDWLFSDAFK